MEGLKIKLIRRDINTRKVQTLGLECLGSNLRCTTYQLGNFGQVNVYFTGAFIRTYWINASLVTQDGKESDYNVGDPGSIPGSGRSPREGNGNPLQYSCPENLMG